MSILLRRISELEKENYNLYCTIEQCNGRIEELEAENKRLREALGKIIGEKKDYERRLPGPSFVVIRIYAEKALKGDKE